ncbi:MAG: PAS domain-containing protein [Deltaproteobacteria bacterium]|nr:PAS domain-containing protein [Deltaproteobacteria bacterium]
MGQYHLHIILVLLSFIANLGLGSVALTIDHRHRLNRSFALLTFALAFWALMKLIIVFSSTDEGALIFTRIGGLAWCFLPALYMPIVYALIRKPATGIHRYVPWAFAAVSSGLFVCMWIPGLMITDMRLERWGYTDMPGWVFSLVFQPYLIGSFVYMIVELVLFSARAGSRDQRMTGLLVLVGLLIPLVGGGITNMVLPSLDIYVFEMALPLSTVNVLIIAYAGTRYRLLSIRVDYVSREIIASIDEALVVIDVDGRVGIANPAALELLGRERSGVVGEHINDFLEGQRFDDDFKKNVGAKKSHSWRITLAREAGEGIEAEVKASELRNDRGALVGYVLVGKKRTA